MTQFIILDADDMAALYNNESVLVHIDNRMSYEIMTEKGYKKRMKKLTGEENEMDEKRLYLEAAISALKEMDRDRPCTYIIQEHVAPGKIVAHEVKGTDAMCFIQDLIDGTAESDGKAEVVMKVTKQIDDLPSELTEDGRRMIRKSAVMKILNNTEKER